MTPKQQKLVASAEAFVTRCGLEVELSVIRDMLAKGKDLKTIAFLMRYRYSLPTLQALRAQLREREAVTR